MVNLPLDPERAARVLSDFIRDTVTAAGFSKVVLGVSGGVDSALSLFLSARAVGPKQVLALRLPYETSSEESLSYAKKVIDITGAQMKTFYISEAVQGVLADLPDAERVRKGNVMARMRMIYLYDQAKAFGGLVIGTGNKTETLLGYSTLHGDGAFDLNPLGDLYKSQVWELAEYVGVPHEIVERPPSAGLWVGQTDEEELGFTYKEVDQVFYLLVEEGKTVAECVEAGFSEAFIREVISRVKRYRFKRTLPPIGSIGQQPLSILDHRSTFTDDE